jgi:hypothetical protein
LNADYAPPSYGVHCELGYGQGLSVNIHAAASGTTWYGTDFNPSQAAFAQSLASSSGADVLLTDQAFAEFCNRSDLPEFDSIGLHGIWSWISDENRSVIVDFIKQKLKVGGVIYISYNTLPGWATFAPIRHLMTEHASAMGSVGKGMVSRIDGALEFAQKLLNTNPLFASANPTVVERLKKVSEQNRNYLAHEYFNKDWHPMHFATMSEWLSPAKISFACSAHYLDHIDAVNLTTEQQALLKEIPDPTFKESVRDFMVNQQFRRDYWVKGARKLSSFETNELIKQQNVLLTSSINEVSLKITGNLGEATLSKKIYDPVLELMSDNKPRFIEEIASIVKQKSISLPQLIQVILVLINEKHMAQLQPELQITRAHRTATTLNQKLMQNACFIEDMSKNISALASCVTGGGVEVSRFEQLFLISIAQGKTNPKDWSQKAWEILSLQNQRLIKDGKAMESVEDNIKELTRQANEFEINRLPILKALQVV